MKISLLIWDGLSANKKCGEDVLNGDHPISLGSPLTVTDDLTHVFKRLGSRFFTSESKRVCVALGGALRDVSIAHVRAILRDDERNSQAGTRWLRNLSEDHLHPQRVEKMRVQVHLRIINEDVIKYGKNFFPEEAATWLYLDMCLAFYNFRNEVVRVKDVQSFESRCDELCKPWRETLVLLADKPTRGFGVQSCFVKTVESVLSCIDSLRVVAVREVRRMGKSYDDAYLVIKKLLQDKCENTQGQQRSMGGSSNNPTMTSYAINADRLRMAQDERRDEENSYIARSARESLFSRSFSLPSIAEILVVESEEKLYEAAIGELNMIHSKCTACHPGDRRCEIVRNLLECLQTTGEITAKAELFRLRTSWKEHSSSSLEATTWFQRVLSDEISVSSQRYIMQVCRTVLLRE
tara:strand:- start:1615 stop:2838 length:1224 start_codon:yes stop_codon:yes gene_type:complete